MQILILNWRDTKNPSSGGAEILTHEIAKRWVSWGHNVIQFSSAFPGCKPEETIDGVKIIRRGRPDVRSVFASVHFQAFWYYQKECKGCIDVVVDEIHGIPFFTPWYVRERKVVLICEVAGELWKKVFGPFFGAIGEKVEKLYLRNVYRKIPCLTISVSTEQDLVRYGVLENNITILPMGITAPKHFRLGGKETKPTVIFVGRLTPQKGIEDAISAFREIKRKLPGAQFWIVGRGDEGYVRVLKKLCRKFGIYKNIRFFGFVSESKKFELMAKSHVLIHPSLREGFGLTIPEAGFVGTPAVGYNSHGIRDLIKNDRNGILLDQNSPETLAQETIFLLQDKKRYKELIRGARKEARVYNWNKTARTAVSILKTL